VPVVLTQHFSPTDRVYQDAEYSLYHYPRVYFSRVRPYDRFIYYRPLGKSRVRADSKHYFGHGVLGEWFADPHSAEHRFVNIIQAEPFRRLVSIVDGLGRYFETESDRTPQFQAAVRDVSETAYYKILATADMSSAGLSLLASTESIAALPFPGQSTPVPRDAFRKIETIPPGAGYVPSGTTIPNVYESAALQERARRDHQDVLQTIQREVLRQGGSTWYNNNVDLFASIAEKRFLIEAKSLGDVRTAVDRVRYGIGQLADYAYRYSSELGAPQKILAFGSRPSRDVAWLGNVLDQERTAFVHAAEGIIEPLNETARELPILNS
jgi:hypothetical protein